MTFRGLLHLAGFLCCAGSVHAASQSMDGPNLLWLLYALHVTPSVVVAARAFLATHSASSALVSALLMSVIAALALSLEAGLVLLLRSVYAIWLVPFGLNLWSLIHPIWVPPSLRKSSGDVPTAL